MAHHLRQRVSAVFLSLIAPATLLALALVSTEGASPPASPLWGPLRPGAHAVGFRVLNASDPTRSLPGATTPRPIQIAVWYPARAPLSPEAMSYGDYVRVTTSERTLEVPTAAQEEETTQSYQHFLESLGVRGPAALAWLLSPMEARRDAESAPGRFPLVLVAQGNGGAVPITRSWASTWRARGMSWPRARRRFASVT